MSGSNPDLVRALRPLGSRDYRLLLAAVAIELFGTGMWIIVMVFHVLVIAHAPQGIDASPHMTMGSSWRESA